MNLYDVCIIGGGASGLAAAAAMDGDLSVCILEKNDKCGRKLLATGGGRCNITNAKAPGTEETVGFFEELGLLLHHDDEGRFYPYSNQAADVAGILLAAISKKNTQVYTGFSADSVRYEASEGGKFFVSDGTRTVTSRRLIIATGGKSYPQFGTTGDGFRLAKDLGHTIERVYPILAPVSCEAMPDVAGVRARAKVKLYKDGREVDSSEGEVQFTKEGLSGICIFDLTLNIRAEDGEKPAQAMKRYEIGLDLAPDLTEEQVRNRASSFGIVTKKLADAVPPEKLKDLRFQVAAVGGWKSAQATAGGVSLDEVREDTMESKIVPGLYFTGEVLDIQYKCGGYNLQNAWITALRAARAINSSSEKE